MLEVDGIHAAYGHVAALRGVSLSVGVGEIVALVGANGAGKSTTLRSISGLLRPHAGAIRFDGVPIDRMRPEKIVALGISHLPEGRGIFPTLTVEENLRMGFYPRRRDTAAWDDGLERVTTMFPRLRERWTQLGGTLSGGEQQMLALARALLPQPRLLMIDELSLGLAPVVVQQLLDTVREINEGGTAVLLVEQYVTLAMRLASTVVVLEKGTVAHAGPTSELEGDADAVRTLYLGGGAGAVKEISRAR